MSSFDWNDIPDEDIEEISSPMTASESQGITVAGPSSSRMTFSGTSLLNRPGRLTTIIPQDSDEEEGMTSMLNQVSSMIHSSMNPTYSSMAGPSSQLFTEPPVLEEPTEPYVAKKIKLEDFRKTMLSFERASEKLVQTHMWMTNFRKGKESNVILHVPQKERPVFYQCLYDYISTTSHRVLDDRQRGENCFTEKVDPQKFRLYVDLDFKIDLIDSGYLSAEMEQLKSQMTVFIDTIHQAVIAGYGPDLAEERYISMRLPYKLHLHYPRIVTNRDAAKALVSHVLKKLKEVPMCKAVLEKDPKVVDESVYNNGLRILGCHKGRMGVKKGKEHEEDKPIKDHYRLLPDVDYYDYYSLVDRDFEMVELTYETFIRLSIHPDPVESLASCSFLASPARKVLSTRQGSQPSNEELETFDMQSFMNAPDGLTGLEAAAKLINTLECLESHYNRIIDRTKIKIKDHKLIVPLGTRECPHIKREHTSNHQYIRVDSTGAKQYCHDCQKAHRHKSAKAFGQKVTNELVALGIIRQLDVTKPSKAKSNDEKMGYLRATLASSDVRLKFPRYDFSNIEPKNVVFKEHVIFYKLPDLWCEVCKTHHESPCTYVQLIRTGDWELRCRKCDSEGTFDSYPHPPMTIDEVSRRALFWNVTVNINNTYIYNRDTSGDVDFIPEKMDVFPDDETLNDLMYEALSGTSYRVVQVLHYIANQRFVCTRDGTWYSYREHRWIQDDSAVRTYISEDLSNLFREARQYYSDNLANPDQAKSCSNKINAIIANLNQWNKKSEFFKEAQDYFHQHDPFQDRKSNKYFADFMDKKLHLVGFTNGVYDLQEMKFRDGLPEDCITITCNYEFDPISRPEKREFLLKFLSDIQPQEPEREYMLHHLASCLHGENIQEQFHVYKGRGRNGKSKMQDLIRMTFGEYFSAISSTMLTGIDKTAGESPQPQLISMRNKRIVMVSEPNATAKLNCNILKQWTGNDILTGRTLNSREIVQFKPQFQLIMLCNDIPEVDRSDDAFHKRSRILNFPVEFTDDKKILALNTGYHKPMDGQLSGKLEQLNNEFMLLLLEYYAKYVALGKVLNPITPQSIRELVEKYRRDCDPIQLFKEEFIIRMPGSILKTKDVFDRFKRWYKEEKGVEPVKHNIGKGNIEDKFQQWGIQFSQAGKAYKGSGTGVHCFYDVAFRPEEDEVLPHEDM